MTVMRTPSRRISPVSPTWPPRLAVERRLVEHDGAGLAGFELGDLLAVLHQRGDDAFGALGLVAEEFGGADFLAQRKPYRLLRGLARARPGGARLGALALHGVVRTMADRRRCRARAARPA